MFIRAVWEGSFFLHSPREHIGQKIPPHPRIILIPRPFQQPCWWFSEEQPYILVAGGCRAGYYDLCLFVKIKHRGNMRSKLSQVGYYNHNVKVRYIFFLRTVYDTITYNTSSRYQGFVASSNIFPPWRNWW